MDSSYVAHIIKEKGLRALAVHLDNGWNSNLAVSNIENLLRKLDIDLYTYVIDWLEFKDIQKSFIESSIPNIELPTDHAINAVLFNLAYEYDIKYIINGSNLATEGILPLSWMARNIDFKIIKNIHKKFGTIPLKTFPRITLMRLAYFILIKKIKFFPILNYVNYKKNEAVKILEDKYNWKKYEHKHFESIFTKFFQAYILPNKFNIDKRKAHLSSMIMSNQISRDEALEVLKKPLYEDHNILNEDKNYFLKKLSYSEEDFKMIMKKEIKSSHDYPSNDFVFRKFKFFISFFKEYTKNI